MDLMNKVECKVPFGTMSIPNRSIDLINEALRDKMVTNGKLVKEFEEKFAFHFDAKHAIAVSSGTDADTLACAALYSLGAKRGISEIIIPALTFISTANAVVNAGFRPVFVDVDRRTLQINIHQIEEVITENTIAIMPVHLMGRPCAIYTLCDIAKRHNLYVIEDCAEAHKAIYHGKQVGTFGEMACYSLYAAHIVSSVEGGMITTDNDGLADTLRSLRNHGLEMDGSSWKFGQIGYNAKMNELEAAVGLGNLDNLEEILLKRRNNYQYLSSKFEKFDPYLYTMKEHTLEHWSPHAFPIIVKVIGSEAPFDKEDLVKWYNECGIDNRNLFYSIPTQCEAYKNFKGDFSSAEYCSKQGTHIGIHQDLTEEQLDYVADKTREFLKKHLTTRT